MTRISAFEFCFKKWAQKIGFLPSVAGQGLKNAKLPSALIEDNPGEIGAFMRGGEPGPTALPPSLSQDTMEKVPLDKPTSTELGCGFHDPNRQHWNVSRHAPVVLGDGINEVQAPVGSIGPER
jgi:hypothetical protein